MVVFLKFIIIKNFKSYKGTIRIELIKTFTAIVGPNGSGKSNIMDAVRFALGEKARNLRIAHFSDLIYGASFGKPTTNESSVTLIFSLDKNTEKSFTRIVHNEGSQYRINNKIVDDEFYKTELSKFNLDVEVGNFLIPQEHIESLALQTPKDQTALFEKLSGSIAFKADYERLKSELLNMKDEIHIARETKKQLLKQIEYTKQEKEQALEYLHLQEEYTKEKSKFQTIRLFLIKKMEETSQDEEKEIKEQIKDNERDKQSEVSLLQKKQSQLKSLFKSLESVEQDVLELENLVEEKKMKYKVFKEEISFWEKKHNLARESLNSANKTHDAHEKTLRELNKESQIIDSKLKALTETSDDGSVSPSDSEVARYEILKGRVNVLTEDFVTINNLKRKQQIDQDKLDDNNRRKQDVDDKLKQISLKKEDLEERLKKLRCLNEEYVSKLKENTEKKQRLSNEVTEERNRLSILEAECTKLEKEICEKTIDKHILSQRNESSKILNMLKKHCPDGVYGRLYELCKPIHERYTIAATKIFGQYMDAIVVDTKSTAQKCIGILKNKKLRIEIFLPLDDSLKVQPLKEVLRTISKPSNVNLLYDVLNYPKDINRAVMFVVGNTMVCETMDDARKLAYESYRQNLDCVSLDGCYFRKNGVFSGGQVSVAARAQKWTEKDITELKERKKNLMQEHRELHKLPLKICEIDEIGKQIKGLDHRNKYIEKELKNVEDELSKAHENNELRKLNKELSSLSETKLELEHHIRERDEQINRLEERVRAIETNVFADFCRDIGVPDIDYYEKNNLRCYKERKITQMELEKQKDCIENQLSFENERDTKDRISRWELAVKQAETKLRELGSKEDSAMKAVKQEETRLEEVKKNCAAVRKDIKDMENELTQCKLRLDAVKKLELANQQKHVDVQKKRYRRKTECNSIFTECRIEDIAIPMLPETSPESFSTSLSVNWGSLMEIDFSQFPKEILDSSEEELRNIVDELGHKLAEIQKQLETDPNLTNPNLKAHDKVDSLLQNMKTLTKELTRMRKKYTKINLDFEKVKGERFTQFSNCLERVCAEIDLVYKSLSDDPSAQAFILSENPEEPYLGGTTCSYQVPLKPFQPLQSLSGGEKTLASLALLFAFQRYKPTPFLFMDESDAALDKTNIKKFISFIRKQNARENYVQIIAITLHKQTSRSADALIGVTTEYNEENQEPDSKIFAILMKKT